MFETSHLDPYSRNILINSQRDHIEHNKNRKLLKVNLISHTLRKWKI